MADDAEALRRRLYAPGATDADRAAFESARPAAPRTAAAASAPDGAAADPDGLPDRSGGPAARRRPTRRVLLTAGGVLAGGAVLGVAALQASRSTPRPVPAPTPLGLDAADRADLLANLARGGEAGIAAYLVTHRSPPGLGGAASYTTVEGRGVGTGALELDGDVPGGAGRAGVLLVLAQDGRAVWTAERLATAGSPAVRLAPVATRGGEQTAGDLTIAILPYAAGRRPVRLEVQAPAGVAWGAAVVFSG